jgi:multicomponent Na+:H+ antiporter subunit E
MRSRLVFFPVSFVVWLALGWPPTLQIVVAGVVVSLLVSYLAGHFFVGRHHLLTEPRRHWHFLVLYVPLFLWEVFKANVDVAYRVSCPRMPIHPGIVAVRTTLMSDMALTFLANSITLTPGTLTVDVDRDRGLLYVHWIDVKTRDVDEATRMIVRRFEPILRRIFEEGPTR